MKERTDQTSEGLNQLFEIINAKGDTGELKEIVEKNNTNSTSDKKEDTK